jgi:xanthine dehydrogenase iron-sulfur cluster and FAD-binding subunit A
MNLTTPSSDFLVAANAKADTFIQPKITGYRQLGKVEADLMNEAKALGAQFEELIGRLRTCHANQRHAAGAALTPENEAERQRLLNAEPERWLAMGRTDIQTGVMKIVRSIAQPAS